MFKKKLNHDEILQETQKQFLFVFEWITVGRTQEFINRRCQN